jgi:hypothetical protein
MSKGKKKIFSSSYFDFNAFEEDAIKPLYDGKPASGKDGIITPLIKRILERAMQGEMEGHLNTEDVDVPNRRNGKSWHN